MPKKDKYKLRGFFIKTEMTDKIFEDFKKILVNKIPSGYQGLERMFLTVLHF